MVGVGSTTDTPGTPGGQARADGWLRQGLARGHRRYDPRAPRLGSRACALRTRLYAGIRAWPHGLDAGPENGLRVGGENAELRGAQRLARILGHLSGVERGGG